MKKRCFFLSLLLLSIVLLLTGCDSIGIGGDETEAQTEPLISLEEMKAYLAEATIIRSEDADDETISAIADMRKTLKETFGAQPEFTDDYVKKGEEVKQAKREILVGTTNRTQSADALKLCTSVEEPLDFYIGKVGDHYVIFAGQTNIREACEIFVQLLTQHRNRTFTYTRNSTAMMKDFTIAGEPFSSFTTIVYPKAYTTMQKKDIDEAVSILQQATGFYLTVAEEGAVDQNAIILSANTDLSGNDYTVRFDKDKKVLRLGGSNYYADIRALYQVIIHGALGYRDGTFTDPKNVDASVLDKIVPYDTDPDLIIGAWMTNAATIDQEFLIRDAAEAHFNLLSIELAGATQTHNLLKWGAMYDVSYVFVDYACYTDYNSNYSCINSYKSSPNHWGNYIIDEPALDAIGAVANAFQNYKKVGPDKFPYVTLFPMYAFDASQYNLYINSFVSQAKPELFSCDIYPITYDKGNYGIWHEYAINLKTLSDAAKKNDTRWNLYIQSCSDTAIHPAMTARDFEWQAWNVISFGGTGYTYFTYVAPGAWPNCILDKDFNKNPQYDYAKEVNGEFTALTPTLSQYEYLGTFTNNGANAPWGKFSGEYKFKQMNDVESTGALLLGAFKEKNGDGYAFSCVNNNMLSDKSKNEVKMKVGGGADVTLWIDGKPKELKADKDGYISFTLNPGQGAFGIIH